MSQGARSRRAGARARAPATSRAAAARRYVRVARSPLPLARCSLASNHSARSTLTKNRKDPPARTCYDFELCSGDASYGGLWLPVLGGIRTVSQLPTLRCRYATLVSSRRNDVTQSGVSSTYVTAANARYAHVYAIRYEGFSPELRLPSPQALVERGSHESLRSDSGSSPVPSDTRYVSNRTGTRLPARRR